MTTNPDLQQIDLWRRQLAPEVDRQMKYARDRGFKVLPITEPMAGYIVTHDRLVMARCNLLLEAAEVAAALAFYREHQT